MAERPDEPVAGIDLSLPHHLPNLRAGRRPRDPSRLPRQRRGITPQMVGRYPDYDVLESEGSWDAATAKVIRERLEVGGESQFFSASERPTLSAFCDRVVAQDAEPRVPVAEMVDRKLAQGQLDGFQYSDMPDDRETWRLTLAGLGEVAQDRHRQPFAELGLELQEAIVDDFHQGALRSPSLDTMTVARAWAVCVRMVLSAFYSHPWAWNEIGFGGPAYPKGFMRFSVAGAAEPFERRGAKAEDPERQVAQGRA